MLFQIDHQSALSTQDERTEARHASSKDEDARTADARPDFVVIGGGPAGLTAAFEAAERGRRPLVLEKGKIVGGISRTETYKGYGFDMGGHRFFTKSAEVRNLWETVLAENGEKFLKRPRLSRIFYGGKFYNYPLKPLNALKNLGWYESAWLMASYMRWKVFPHKQEETFEEWVVNRFGRRLFRTFFKTYTEKVWGISTQELKAEWAAQRIKNLSLRSAVMGGIFKPKHGKITTLIEEFHYPRHGPGLLWECFANSVERRDGRVERNAAVETVHREDNRVTGVTWTDADGRSHREDSGAPVVNTMPLAELVRRLDPPPPQPVLDAAKSLKYRDFLTVCLIVDDPDLFPDNWIYIHDPSVQVGRIQNFGNWSPEMIPEADRGKRSSLGLEYFCNEGDALWSLSNDELVKLAKAEIDRIGLCPAGKVVDGVVYRVPKSYPVYDAAYAEHVRVIREYVDNLENLRTVGRNGLHRYNNQDHSMLTGLYAVRSLLEGETHDLWAINADQEYHEEVQNGDREPGRVGRNIAVAPSPAPGVSTAAAT